MAGYSITFFPQRIKENVIQIMGFFFISHVQGLPKQCTWDAAFEPHYYSLQG